MRKRDCAFLQSIAYHAYPAIRLCPVCLSRCVLFKQCWIEKLTPIQIAAFDLAEYQRLRGEFTTDEWIDLMLRSMGYEPAEMTKRLKLLFLTRLIPLCERNFNLVELGPRGTGKSYIDSGGLALYGPHDRSNDGGEPVRTYGRQDQRACPDLGRGRLR